MSQGTTHTDKAAGAKVTRTAVGPGRPAGVGAGQATPMTLGERIAYDLSAAEGALAEAENRYIGAKHGWADEMRRRGQGDSTEWDVAKAQDALAEADEARRQAAEKIEELRQRLYNQRRREILAAAVTGQQVAHDDVHRRMAEYEKPKRKSLLARIFRR